MSLSRIVFIVFCLVLILGVPKVLGWIETRLVFIGAYMDHESPVVLSPRVFRLEREVGKGKKVYALFRKSLISSKGLMVFAHGNGEKIEDSFSLVEKAYDDLGFDVLFPEYRGYGESKGVPSEGAIVEDFIFFLDEALKQNQYDKILFHGRSLGGGVLGAVYAKRPVATHFLFESTFTSLADVIKEGFGIPAILIRNKFKTVENIKSFNGHALIIHGKSDRVVPLAHGEKLKELLGERADYLLLDCGHNDCSRHGVVFWSAVRKLTSRSKESTTE